MRSFLLIASLCAVQFAFCQVVPPAYENVEGEGNFFYNNTFADGMTFQFLIDDSILSGLVNRQIVGLRFRLDGTQGSYSEALNFSDFEVRIGVGVEVPEISQIFSNNHVGGLSQVRDGSFTFDADSFPFGENPNDFGPTIGFDSGYSYFGGNLLIELRSQLTAIPNNQFILDAATVSAGPGNGYGVDFAAIAEQSSTATFGSRRNFIVTDLITAPVPEPATAASLMIGFAAYVRRRRNYANFPSTCNAISK